MLQLSSDTSSPDKPIRNPNHKDLTCHYCGKKGHISPNCYKKHRDMQSKGKASTTERGGKGKSKSEIIFHSEVVHSAHTVEWLIDSGATSHMINSDKELINVKPKGIQILAADKQII